MCTPLTKQCTLSLRNVISFTWTNSPIIACKSVFYSMTNSMECRTDFYCCNFCNFQDQFCWKFKLKLIFTVFGFPKWRLVLRSPPKVTATAWSHGAALSRWAAWSLRYMVTEMHGHAECVLLDSFPKQYMMFWGKLTTVADALISICQLST